MNKRALATTVSVGFIVACGGEAPLGPPSDTDSSETLTSTGVAGMTDATGDSDSDSPHSTTGGVTGDDETTGTTGGAETTLTGAPEAVCGDGVVEDDEECDDDSPFCDPVSCTWACAADGACLTGDWARSLGGRGVQRVIDALTTPDGGYYIVVEFVGEVAFGGVELSYEPSSRSEVGVVKIAADDSVEWVHSFGGEGWQYASDATVDAAGDLYIAGGFKERALLGETSYEATLEGDKDIAQYIVKIAGGAEVEERMEWSHKLAERDPNLPDYSEAEGLRLAVDAQGRLLVQGTAWDLVSIDDAPPVFEHTGSKFAYFLRFDTEGALLQEHSFDFEALEPLALSEYSRCSTYKVLVDGLGNVFWAGHINFALDLAGAATIAEEHRGAFLVKFNPAGELAWVREFSTLHTDSVTVAPDDLGGGALAFVASGVVDVGCGPKPVSEDATILWVARYGADGSCLWDRAFESVSIHGLELARDDGALVLAGGSEYLSGVGPDFGGGPLLESLAYGQRATYLASFASQSGEHLWSRALRSNASDSVLRWGNRVRLLERQGGLLLVEDYNDDVDAQGLSPEHGLVTASLGGGGELSDWATHGAYTASQIDYGLQEMSVDAADNIVIAGRVEGPLYVDDAFQQVNLSPGEHYLARFTGGGALDWSARVGVDVYDVATTASGGIWIAGGHTHSATVQGCALPAIEGATRSYFVARLSPGGECLGRRQFHEVNTNENSAVIPSFSPRLFPRADSEDVTLIGVVHSLAYQEGSYVELGEVVDTSERKIVRVALDADSYALGSLHQRPLYSPLVDMKLTDSGDALLLSAFQGPEDAADWDGEPFPDQGSSYIVRTTPALDKVWDVAVEGTGVRSDTFFDASPARVQLVSTYSFDAVELPGGVHPPSPEPWGRRLLTVAFDQTGVYQWSRDFEFDAVHDVALTADDTTLVAVAKEEYGTVEGWGLLRVGADGEEAHFIASELARAVNALHVRDDGVVLIGAGVREASSHWMPGRPPLKFMGDILKLGDYGGGLLAAFELSAP